MFAVFLPYAFAYVVSFALSSIFLVSHPMSSTKLRFRVHPVVVVMVELTLNVNYMSGTVLRTLQIVSLINHAQLRMLFSFYR